MVLYFEPLHHGPGKEDFLVRMGRDKFENEDLIKYGLPHDVWCVLIMTALCRVWTDSSLLLDHNLLAA